LLFSANLGYLRVLGDKRFLYSGDALSQCITTTWKVPIAEDEEVAEVRRENNQ